MQNSVNEVDTPSLFLLPLKLVTKKKQSKEKDFLPLIAQIHADKRVFILFLTSAKICEICG